MDSSPRLLARDLLRLCKTHRSLGWIGATIALGSPGEQAIFGAQNVSRYLACMPQRLET